MLYLTVLFVSTQHFDSAYLLQQQTAIHAEFLHFLLQLIHCYLINNRYNSAKLINFLFVTFCVLE